MQPSQGDTNYVTQSNSSLLTLLRERAADCGQRSMTARLVSVIDLVEVLLARGYSRSQILEVLTECGWSFTPNSFDSALSRIRKRKQLSAGSSVMGDGSVSGESGDLSTAFGEIFSTRRRNWRGE